MTQSVHGGDIYRHPNVIDFSSNMNPLGPPPAVVRAAQESISEIANYPDVRCGALREALSLAEKVPEEWLLCGNGAAELIFALAFSQRPGRALVASPTFAEYEQALVAAGSTVCHVPLLEENGFEADASLAEAIQRERPDMVILCNPNNPTGLLIPPGILERVRAACKEQGSLLVMDECFLDFVEGGEALSQKPYLSGQRLLILRAFTKRYAMAGLRLGYAICADADVLARMRAAMQPWSVSIPAQAAGRAALLETEYVRRSLAVVKEEREYLARMLRELGFTVYGSRANYLFFRAGAGLKEALLTNGILIRSCANYRGLGEEYYRIAVRRRGDNERLKEALEGICAGKD